MSQVHNISFGNAAVAVKEPGLKEKIGEKFDDYKEGLQEEGVNTEKVLTGASVISTIGLAALLLYRGLRKRDAGAIQQALQPATQRLQAQLPAAPVRLGLPAPTPTPAQIVEQRTATAASQVINGTPYAAARRQAKAGLDHNEKKAVQSFLNNLHSNKVAAEKATQRAQSNLTQTAISANTQMNTQMQRANTVTADTVGDFKKGVQATVDNAKQAAAAKKAGVQEKLAQGQKVTRTERKMAQLAQNQATEAERKGARAIAKAEASAAATQAAEERKLQSALEYMEHTTPEQRAAQAAKAAVEQDRAAVRKTARKLSNPKYKRETAKLERKGDEALAKIAQNDKDPLIREIASNILKSRA